MWLQNICYIAKTLPFIDVVVVVASERSYAKQTNRREDHNSICVHVCGSVCECVHLAESVNVGKVTRLTYTH